MKFNFKKITAMAGVFMASMFAVSGAVMASDYPAPFSDNVANTAIVYGSSALDTDESVANSIQADLAEYADSSSSVNIDGESFKLEKSSVKFHYGDALNDIYPTVDGEDLEESLADGTYKDGDVDTEYEQEISLGDTTLGLFTDRDYNDEEPTLGFHWGSNDGVLDYTIDFDDDVNFSEMVDTEMPLLGEDYYVLDADSESIELLDSSNKATFKYGETVTIGDKEVTASFISSDGAKLSVDGETTDQLKAGEYEELSDGTYVVVTEVLASSLESMDSSVEVAIGSGKSILTDGDEVELNEEDVDGLTASFGGTDTLDSLTLSWSADEDLFLTEENPVTMPGFSSFSLVFGGLNYPDESETISVESGEQLNLRMDNYDLPLMYYNGSVANLGEEYETIVTDNSSYSYAEAGYDNETIWWEGSGSNVDNTTDFTNDSLALEEDNRFLVTQLDIDASGSSTLYYEVSSIDNVEDGDGEFEVVLDDLIGTSDLTFSEVGETNDNDDVEVTLVGFSEDNSTAYFEFSPMVSGDEYPLAYDRAVSDKGMVIDIPTDLSTIGDGVTMNFTEANYRGDVGGGETFSITVSNTSDDMLHVSGVDSTKLETEEHSDDVYEGYVISDLASKVVYDKSSDENDFEVEYFGKEATADVSVAASDSVTTDTSETGAMLITDSEVSDYDDHNLIVVGGSCVNTAAANLLGVSEGTCGSDFTEATGVGSGQALIQGFSDSDLTSEHAVLVAGYSADGTSDASKYLMNEAPDTSEKLKVTSATEASVVSE